VVEILRSDNSTRANYGLEIGGVLPTSGFTLRILTRREGHAAIKFCKRFTKERRMRLIFSAAVAGVLLSATPLLADSRPVTNEERQRLVDALAALNCTGGELEFDDDKYFEVDDATCADGRKYDLKFDAGFKLLERKLDD